MFEPAFECECCGARRKAATATLACGRPCRDCGRVCRGELLSVKVPTYTFESIGLPAS